MLTFKEFISTKNNIFEGLDKVDVNVPIPVLKPNLFLKDENFATLDEYVTALKNGIDNSPLPEKHKELLHNLVDITNGTILSKTCFYGGLNGYTLKDFGEKISNNLNANFGELLGPIKILRDASYMPWISGCQNIWVPQKGNYGLIDYAITDSNGITHKISAKTAKGLGNTAKIPDILKQMELAIENETVKKMDKRLFGDVGKYSKEYKVLKQVFDVVKDNTAIPGTLKAAAILDAEYGDGTLANIVKHLDGIAGFYASLDKKTYKKTQIQFGNTKTTLGAVLSDADAKIKLYTKAPGVSLANSKINRALCLLINIAFKDSIYYAKFAVKTNGSTVWYVRGRTKEYSKLYPGNDNRGSTYFTNVYLDAKGARIKDKIGLRIESFSDGKNAII